MVLITCLANVATQVGVGRILGGNKFHHPVGKPELPLAEERQWRTQLLERALKLLREPHTGMSSDSAT